MEKNMFIFLGIKEKTSKLTCSTILSSFFIMWLAIFCSPLAQKRLASSMSFSTWRLKSEVSKDFNLLTTLSATLKSKGSTFNLQ